ncbi:AraC family transcriptional regulator [Hymenobacter terrenus]|uniref:AraC family transcriptional regulator n=1 Tax=Hymenobacter terrenus TaxID=1629124 RepID=UPI0018CE024E|nr:helix-turn-helix domain-containing protein [Hymenobacter terrenus]
MILAEEKSFAITLRGSMPEEADAVLLPGLLPHRFLGQGHRHFFLFFDPDSEASHRLLQTHYRASNSIQRLIKAEFLQLSALLTQWVDDASARSETLQQLVQLVRAQFFSTVTLSIDPRVAAVIGYIKGEVEAELSMRVLTQRADLSESRLAHLFKAQMGMPIRKYIIWVRIKRALQAVSNGRSLTEAAYEGGFADGAHFSHTFSAMFGAAPSVVLHK